MSTTTYVFVEKQERYQHFSDKKGALSVAMAKTRYIKVKTCKSQIKNTELKISLHKTQCHT